MAITRAAFGARLWTNNVKELIAKLERQSGEKTSSSEGLGRLKTDRVDAFSKRREGHLENLRAEQERDRNERRDRALERQLHYRDRSPRGAAEHHESSGGAAAGGHRFCARSAADGRRR